LKRVWQTGILKKTRQTASSQNHSNNKEKYVDDADVLAPVQPWGAAGARFSATFMFKLTAGQSVRVVEITFLQAANSQEVSSAINYKKKQRHS
jgi:hypothetical protein